ncbi:MAG: hypothetical protein HZB47_09180 [Nitrosomonadales bacterium]|nr:hypothetical protein [Nitrosomonadales bacterium]
MADESLTENLKIEQYKAYMQDVANIGSRHETARGFYLSVLSALLAFVALAGKDGPLSGIGSNLFIVISLGAIAICILWFLNTLSFSALYGAKLGQLHKMEEVLPFKNFTDEYKVLKKNWRYIRLTTVECFVAGVFAILFTVALALNWCAR